MFSSFNLTFLVGTVVISILSLQGSAWFSPNDNMAMSDGSSNSVTPSSGVPIVRQNFSPEVNTFLNDAIILGCLEHSYIYMMMNTYFNRADVALPGFAKYFKTFSERELANANSLMEYINKRGGEVEIIDIKGPDVTQWVDGVAALTYTLTLERDINADLLKLHKMAEDHNDAHLKMLVEDVYLDQKVKVIKEVVDHLTNLERMRGANYGLGEYLFDKDVQ